MNLVVGWIQVLEVVYIPEGDPLTWTLSSTSANFIVAHKNRIVFGLSCFKGKFWGDRCEWWILFGLISCGDSDRVERCEMIGLIGRILDNMSDERMNLIWLEKFWKDDRMSLVWYESYERMIGWIWYDWEDLWW